MVNMIGTDLSSLISLAALPNASGSGKSQSVHASTTACGSAYALPLLLDDLTSSFGAHSPCIIGTLIISRHWLQGICRLAERGPGQDVGLVKSRLVACLLRLFTLLEQI